MSVIGNECLKLLISSADGVHRNWHPSADRTASGYYKNLSLQERVDPFTGELTGSAAVVRSSGRGESA